MAHQSVIRVRGKDKRPRAKRGAARRYFEEVVLNYHGEECLIWPHSRATDGRAQLNGVGRVHVAACEAENGPRPSPDHGAAHSCGNGHIGCVARKHLRWATQKENVADTLMHGTRSRGSRHGRSKISENHVREIRMLAARGDMSQTAIAGMFGITRMTVSDIHCRRSWSWLE